MVRNVNDVAVLKFVADGKDFEKNCKVSSIYVEDNNKKMRSMENEHFKHEAFLDDNGKTILEKNVEDGKASVTKYEYAKDGTVYERTYDSDGNQTGERVTTEENGRKITNDGKGKETVIENIERDGIKVRKIIRSKNGKIFEKTERHFDSNGHGVYYKTESGNEVLESWAEFDETGYCIHQKQSDGIEFRNVKSDDKKYVVMYKTENGIEEISGITELCEENGVKSQISFELVQLD